VGICARHPSIRDYNVYRVMPFSVALSAAQSDNHGRATGGRDALLYRHYSGTMTNDQYERIVATALARQADRSLPWDYFWGDMVDIARYQGHVSDAEWRQFLTEACRWELVIPPGIPEKEDIVYEFRLVGDRRTSSPRPLNTRYLGLTHGDSNDKISIAFDGTTSQGNRFHATVKHDYIQGGNTYYIRTTNYPEIRIPPGRYTCSVSISWSVYDAAFGIMDQHLAPRVSYTDRQSTRTDRITYRVAFEIVSREAEEYGGVEKTRKAESSRRTGRGGGFGVIPPLLSTFRSRGV